MAFEKFSLKNISPFWKRAVIGLSCLSALGWGLSNLFDHKSPVLNSAAQDKSDDLSSIDRVKSLYAKPTIKNDPIADASTQKLMAAMNPNFNQPYNADNKETKLVNKTQDPIKLNINSDINMPLNSQSANLNPSMVNNTNKVCDAYDAALGKCSTTKEYQDKVTMIAENISSSTKPSLSDANVKDGFVDASLTKADLTSTTIPSQNNTQENTFNKNGSQNLSQQQQLPPPKTPMGLLIASVGKTETLAGRTSDIGGAEDQIKAGTTVLAVLNEAKTITSSGEQFASASIIGAPFDHKKFPEGVTVLLKMKLNGTQDGIEGQIINCASRRNNDKTISCAGQLEDINGESVLRGEVYSSTGWQILTTALTTLLSGISLGKITTSATELGVTQDQTTTNAIYQGLSTAIISMGQEIASSFARSGTQISIPGRVVVRILFTQDSVW